MSESVFSSEASNLVTGDTNGRRDVFWKDRLTGETQLVSRADGADGAPGDSSSGGDPNGGQGDHGISADGRYVVFYSGATNLSEDDTNDVRDVYVRDVVAQRTLLVSRTDGGAGLFGDRTPQGRIDISEDGRYVAAENLPGTEGGDVRQIYRHDLVAGRTLLISRTAAGVPGDGDSRNAVITKHTARRKGLSLTKPTTLKVFLTFRGNAHLDRATTMRRLVINRGER